MTKRINQLSKRLLSLSKKYDGTPGVHIIRLDTGEETGINADRDFPTASMIKIAVLVTILSQVQEKKLSWKRRFVYDDTYDVRGSGLLQYMDTGLRPTLKDWAILMMSISDNRATNFLIDLAGKENINRFLRKNKIRPMLLRGGVFRKNARPKGTRHFAQATPRAFTSLLSKLIQGELLNKKWTREAMGIMRIQQFIHRIREHLPANPFSRPKANPEDEDVWVASKSGSFIGFKGETGIIHLPESNNYIVLAVMGENSKDNRPSTYNKGDVFISKCSEAAWKILRD